MSPSRLPTVARRLVRIVPALVALGAGAFAAEEGAVNARALTCEHLINPAGIGVARPRLSWVPVSDRRNDAQTAYQILVASSPERLARSEGDLWDSGRVASDRARDHRYAGVPLRSNQPCWWKVRLWDREGRAGRWSEPAEFSTGLLKSDDWIAQWIGWNASRPASSEEDFGAAQWITHAADPEPAPAAARYLARVFELPAPATSALLLVTVDDRGAVWLNGERVMQTPNVADAWKQARSADVARHLRAGTNMLVVEVRNAAPGPCGMLLRLRAALAGGGTMELVSDGEWVSTASPPANWGKTVDFSKWAGVRVIGPHGVAPWGRIESAAPLLPPARYLRGEFLVARPLRRAMLYTTALGIHDAWLNGERVSDDWFNPGWTDYRRRVYWRAYDVTARVRSGTNVLGAVLADGWFSGYVGYGRQRDHYGLHPRWAAQLHLEYADGSTEVVATGPHFRAAAGALLEADFLMGEVCDARREPRGWAQPGFDASGWAPVDVGAALTPRVEWHPGPPVRVVGQFRPRAWTEPAAGVWVADLGQNFAGVVRLRVRGRPGQRIQLRFAERLNPDGTIYTENLRSARATDVYICRGESLEEWTPRFTFHGFQYVEVTGLDGPPSEDLILGLALSSDTPRAGEFECSDPALNRLWLNTLWTQYANFIDIPTDCPQRDERLGWTGDAQAYIRTACMNTDVQAFFTKWLVDLIDAQRPDGQFPMVAPLKVAGDDGGPAWADAGVICPWILWDVYGDRELLERQYESMKRFVEFCVARSTSDLRPPDKFHCFGDWLHINAETPKPVIYSAYLAISADLTARAAAALGRPEDERRYREIFERAAAAFRAAHVKPDGRVAGDTQTAYILALAAGVLTPEQRSLAARHLADRIAERDHHLSTGFVGTRDILGVLSAIGRHDLAYRLLHNDTFPSWLFTVRHGATTIWERWDGWTPDKGFQTPAMNSFAHYAFGAVYQWMVENIGGIRNEAPGYRAILIAPVLDPWLEWARVRYDSAAGRIVSAWRMTAGGGARFEIEVPCGVRARVLLPVLGGSTTVTEDGRPLRASADVRRIAEQPDALELEVGGGRYVFEAARVWKPAKIERPAR
ncbi:MAG: glycoside hydrolase family 78 protein [Kiritimatiellae bacterium]|nr:glycoside hydrolase family 78 protein [Kiritimatiellia bacterium]